MNKKQPILKSCTHTYIMCLGKEEKTNNTFDYCFNCNKRLRGINYGSLVIDASNYLKEYSLSTEEDRLIKLLALKEEYLRLAKEENISFEELIAIFKSKIETRREPEKIKIKINIKEYSI